MTRSADWPAWLTPAQFNVIQGLAATAQFTWSVRNEPADKTSVIYGQWTRGLGDEINVVLRAPMHDHASTSLVGVYPRGQGFYVGGREPAMVTPVHSATGTADEVLELAKAWAKENRS